MNHGSTSSSDGQPAVELRDWMSCQDHLGNYEQIPDVKPSLLMPSPLLISFYNTVCICLWDRSRLNINIRQFKFVYVFIMKDIYFYFRFYPWKHWLTQKYFCISDLQMSVQQSIWMWLLLWNARCLHFKILSEIPTCLHFTLLKNINYFSQIILL